MPIVPIVGEKVIVLMLGALMAMTPLAVAPQPELSFAEGANKEIREYKDYFEIVITDIDEETEAIHIYIEKENEKNNFYEGFEIDSDLICNQKVVVINKNGEVKMWDDYREFEQNNGHLPPLSDIGPKWKNLSKEAKSLIREWQSFVAEFDNWPEFREILDIYAEGFRNENS